MDDSGTQAASARRPNASGKSSRSHFCVRSSRSRSKRTERGRMQVASARRPHAKRPPYDKDMHDQDKLNIKTTIDRKRPQKVGDRCHCGGCRERHEPRQKPVFQKNARHRPIADHEYRVFDKPTPYYFSLNPVVTLRHFSYRTLTDADLERINHLNTCPGMDDGDGTYHLLTICAFKCTDTVDVHYEYEHIGMGLKISGRISEAVIGARTFLSHLIFHSEGLWAPGPVFKNMSCARAWHAKRLIKAKEDENLLPKGELLGVIGCFVPYSKNVPLPAIVSPDEEDYEEDFPILPDDYEGFLVDPGYKMLKDGAGGLLEVSYTKQSGSQWKTVCV